MPRALRLVETPAMLQRIAVVRHMIMTIDKARQNRHAADVDDLGIGRPVALIARRDRLDAIVAQDDRCALDRRRASAVDQPAASEHLHLHRLPPHAPLSPILAAVVVEKPSGPGYTGPPPVR